MKTEKRLIIVIFTLSILQFNLLLTNYNMLISFVFAFVTILSLFGFNQFEFKYQYIKRKLLIRYLLGSAFGSLIQYLIVSLFSANTFLIIIYNFIFSFIILYILFLILIKFIDTHKKVTEYIVIGNYDKFQNILKEISQASYYTVKFIHKSKYEKISSTTLHKYLKTTNNILLLDSTIDVKDFITKSKIQSNSVNIVYLPTLVDEYLNRIPLEVFDEYYDYYFMSTYYKSDSKSKRIFDIISSLILIAIFSPAFLFLSLYIYFADGRPILFIQSRVGYRKSAFKIYKFRSMKVQDKKEQKYAKDEENRFYRGSKTIRSTRLDELPQLFNILKGDLSLIGPRPEQIEFFDKLSEKHRAYALRQQVKPGLIGLAQISYKYAETDEQQLHKLSYDLYYIKNRTFILDVIIVLKTVEVFVFRIGSK